ncbi:hypothetical protein FRC03_000364 [Tulasnella sp. 419]|nr:hypothetical protein FRC03_000364 [Tulasnella sp. 419]
MSSTPHHQPGKCAIRGTCGSKGRWGPQLPCPYNGPPEEVTDNEFRSLLTSVCGPEIAESAVCCTSEQVETLQANFQQAESIISTCPACRNNFRSFYCTFTCSPDQSTFLDVTSTQTTSTGDVAVKSLDFYVAEKFGKGFYDSCKDVKFGATNGYAMDLIGGGAKNWTGFLQYMGDERPGLGSPFQIDYPPTYSSDLPNGVTPLNPPARSCADPDLGSRCACVDCADVCPALPPPPPPPLGEPNTCNVGELSCLSFILVLAYSLAVFAFFSGYSWMRWKRKTRKYERVPLSGDTSSVQAPSSNGSNHRHSRLIGATSLSGHDGEDSTGGLSDSRILGLGRGQSLLDPLEVLQPRHYRLNTFIRRSFYRLGRFCAKYPWVTLAMTAAFIGLLNFGWTQFQVETDPVRLWVAKTSETKAQKEFFDEKFGPFYRPQQIFVTSHPEHDNHPKGGVSPVLSLEHLKYWFKVEEEIRALRSTPNGYGLEDVCFKPAGEGSPCVVQSIGAWFGYDLSRYDEDSWREQVIACAERPSECLPDYGQPLGPKYILGGIPDTDDKKRWLDSKALVVNYILSNSNDPKEVAKAEEWERALRVYLAEQKKWVGVEAGLDIAYSTGVSLEEELNASTNTDFKIVAASYVTMFLYVSIALGGGFSNAGLWNAVGNQGGTWRSTLNLRGLFIGSKAMLGLFGICLVLVSISTSVGFFSMIGVKVTLIIAEVIPFLVLAVGVDNVFILVHELDRQNSLHGPKAASNEDSNGNPNTLGTTPMSPSSQSHITLDPDSQSMVRSGGLSPEERVARTLAKMGPSILLSSITETVAFALGALVPMPAVRNFALYAAGSVFLGAVLQVTAFVAAMTLDLRREEDNRVDCLPCIKIPTKIALPLDTPPSQRKHGVLSRFMRRYYAPFLLRPVVKGIVIAIFSGLFIASIISIQHIELGLDQRLALPSDSYLVPYFDAVDKYLEIGPPVYFVSTDVNVTTRTGQRHLCARFTTCDDLSLANTLEGERKRTESSFIAEPAAGWLDDFFQWLDPRIESCCRVRKRDPTVFCNPRDSDRLCKPCFQDRKPEWNITLHGMPEGEEFMRYLKQWLQSPTDEDCPLGGKAAYSTALALNDDGVVASHYRTFHAPLKTQQDFINALAAANRIADDISKRTGTTVFPYSLFYVFFEQYAHIVGITQEILGLGLASVLLVTAVLLGSWRTGTIVTSVVALTVVNVMGVMGIWGIWLNALSLVNLVISLGIAVEFCSHIARAFMSAGVGLPVDHAASGKDRDERVWMALGDVGPSVLSGITFTKLIGISVLAMTRSKLLEVSSTAYHILSTN